MYLLFIYVIIQVIQIVEKKFLSFCGKQGMRFCKTLDERREPEYVYLRISVLLTYQGQATKTFVTCIPYLLK